ncbi:hypothetical protein DMB92_03730 [Campylobacter sp. MIT 99-7217]|uniref:NAD(P)H-binding protein n=1 Tax=Campylobacter sp. MIT 99-7217 TaxID=535091 RepID=UPI0011594225|nr:NAD(P)H-binding protein [Campylobacter sp. MIT 99-7217]TQR33079.1 hypothetical protein DMB92_03730 [Campylobacter sp. MIT 99-7217]
MKILIIGANGSVAKEVTSAILKGYENVNLKLFLRNSSRLQNVKNANPDRVELFEGDATDKVALKKAMQGVDVVYANLAGDLPKMAEAIMNAMSETGLKISDGVAIKRPEAMIRIIPLVVAKFGKASPKNHS